MTLLTDVNRPGSQEDVVINGEPAHGLVEDAVSGAKIAAAPCLVVLAIAQLPLCLCGGRALSGSCLALLCYLLNPLFCEYARGHSMELEPLVGKGFCFCFFVSLAIPRFGLLSHISSLRLPSGNSGPVLTLRTNDAAHISLPSPHSLVVNEDVCVTSPSPRVVVVKHVFCILFVCFSSQLCCPLKFQNSPQTHL